jgi:hypothetical protein
MVVNTNSGVFYLGGQFFAAGTRFVTNVLTWDGTNWSGLGPGLNGPVYALALDANGTLYAGGQFTKAGTVPATNIAKWDGNAWSGLASGVNSTVYALALDGAGNLYAGGTFTAASGVPANCIVKWDGTSWSALGSGVSRIGSTTVYALAVDPAGKVYVGGFFSSAGGSSAGNIAVWDGAGWSTMGAGMDNAVRALAIDKAGNLYAGGGFRAAGGSPANFMAVWNGIAWSPMDSGFGSGAWVQAILLDGSGNVFAGGDFSIGSSPPQPWNVARWNGTSWSPLGGGLGQSGAPVTCLAEDASGTLHAGGYFSLADEVDLENGIAKWDGTSWGPLQLPPQGPNGEIHALALDKSGLLYTGGKTVPAKWDGTNWLALGYGIAGFPSQNPQVNVLTFDTSGNLYAAGAFHSMSGLIVTNIAMWDGSNWCNIGSGVGPSDAINALTVDKSGILYAGSSHVTSWNGTTWSDLGVAQPGIYALVTDSSGNLYAGGYFTSIGNVPANGVARWDGITWSALGSGMNPYVYSLAVDKLGNLYAGGNFATAGGTPVAHIAKWDGSSWSALGAGLAGNVAVFGLAFDSVGDLYAAGSGISVGGGISIAKWDGQTWSGLGSGTGGGGPYAVACDQSWHLYLGGSFDKAGTNYAQYIAQANLVPGLGMISANDAGGFLRMFLQGNPGSTCVLQTSINLRDWSTISTNLCDTNGLWTFTNSVTGPQRFFRALLP